MQHIDQRPRSSFLRNSALLLPVAALLAVSASSSQAATIVAGAPDYVGDFSGVAINTSNVVQGDDLPSIADTGWEGSARWIISGGSGFEEAVRDSSLSGFQDAGLGIAFAAPNFTSGVLSLDYDANGATTDNSGLPNLVLYTIDDVNPTALDSSAGVDLSSQDFSSQGTEGAPSLIGGGAGERYAYRLIDEWKLTAASGTFNSGTISLQPAGSVDIVGYVFGIRSNAAVSDVTIDNVTLAVPEPAAVSLLIPAFAAFVGLFRRPRR